MDDSARTEIYARVRGATANASAADIAKAVARIGPPPGVGLPSADICTSFLANVLRNRGTVACAKDRGAVVTEVAKYLYQHFRSQRLVVSSDPLLAALPWRNGGLLPRFGCVENGDPIAVVVGRLGVAETGAVVTWSGKTQQAANNLLPEHQIVVVERGNLVATLEQAWDTIRAAQLRESRPRAINFIAGPSSTADIEHHIVYGAHGPRGWHVILLGESGDNTEAEARKLASVCTQESSAL